MALSIDSLQIQCCVKSIVICHSVYAWMQTSKNIFQYKYFLLNKNWLILFTVLNLSFKYFWDSLPPADLSACRSFSYPVIKRLWLLAWWCHSSAALVLVSEGQTWRTGKDGIIRWSSQRTGTGRSVSQPPFTLDTLDVCRVHVNGPESETLNGTLIVFLNSMIEHFSKHACSEYTSFYLQGKNIFI